MCGFVGFTRPEANATRVLRDMMAQIAHRGPDADGVWVDDQIAAGHLRLSIIDPVGGAQPRFDAPSGDLLVYNGEIYDFRDQADALRREGISLRDGSDTEVLFQTIRHRGVEAALEGLDGMFAFAYRDGETGTITLARDRFGEKPLFYALIGGTLVFASELKALRRHPLCAHPDFDLEAIGQYLGFDYVPAPRTGFRSMRKLRPGHLLTFDGERLEERPYWRLPLVGRGDVQDSPAPTTEAEAVDALDRVLRSSIESRLVADVPVGVFLSGGIDSGLIAALACDYAPGIAAYTIKLPGDGYDETPFAAQVAEKYGLRHVVREVNGTEVLHALDRIEAKADEPFADPSIVPTYLLCETARQGVTVALGGDGGDELFAGYVNFQARRMAGLMRFAPPALGAGLRQALSWLAPSDRYMGLSFKLAQLSQGFGHPEALQSFLWMAPFHADLLRRLTQGTMSLDQAMTPVRDHAASLEDARPLDRLQSLFASLYLPDDILTKVDRASMYNSLEVRAPFLARELAEFAMALQPRMRVRGFETKYILKKLALRYLPQELVERPKHGFAIPVSGLLRGPLRERVSDVLLDRSNPMDVHFDGRMIEELLSAHLSGQRDHRKRLWSLYCLFRFAATARETRVAAAA